MSIKFVFVQLGAFTPPYIGSNLKRLSLIFPDTDIFLITNNAELSKLKIKGITLINYETNSQHQLLLEKLNHKLNFRQGFWRYSFERLMALTEFQIRYKIDRLLHLESDVLVFPNLPLEIIKNQNKLYWCQYNSNLDVASLLYSPSTQSAEFLQQNILKELKVNFAHTDMTILNTIRKKNLSEVCTFPSAPSRESHLINANSNFQLNTHSDIYSKFKVFKGIFDPAAIGVWLFGKNPENHQGFLKLHDEWLIESGDSYIDPSKTKYVFQSDGLLFLSNDSELIPIYNVHVHSKDVKILGQEWIKHIDKFIKLSKASKPINSFNLKLFLSLIFIQIRRGQIIQFIKLLPWIYKLRLKFLKIFGK